MEVEYHNLAIQLQNKSLRLGDGTEQLGHPITVSHCVAMTAEIRMARLRYPISLAAPEVKWTNYAVPPAKSKVRQVGRPQ